MALCEKNPDSLLSVCLECIRTSRASSCQPLWGPVREPLNRLIQERALSECSKPCSECALSSICSHLIRKLVTAAEWEERAEEHMTRRKKVVISCGPIPARVDSVKFLTNRFKGGLAFRTAEYLIDSGKYDVTVVKWEHTSLPSELPGRAKDYWARPNIHIVNVKDVFDYYTWFETHATEYDAFILAAAVANLTPSHPFEGKFPSHNYQVGEKFSIEFEIAPRAIDVVKQLNPRCCLIGYKLFDTDDDNELIDIARHTLCDSRANIIFANRPDTAKDSKLAVMPDNAVLRCCFEHHLKLITAAINAEYLKTEIIELTDSEKNDPNIREALCTVKMFEQTFHGFGTVAIPVQGHSSAFATTSRGHRGEPVLVRAVDFDNRTINASERATLNAPALAAALDKVGRDHIVVHRHNDDPLFGSSLPGATAPDYLFPGSLTEATFVSDHITAKTPRVALCGHGDIRCLPIKEISWANYYQEFPSKYFSYSSQMDGMLCTHAKGETLEVGCNKRACTKYAYDPFVAAENAVNLTLAQVSNMTFDLTIIKNAINYIPMETLKVIINRSKNFIANTFLYAPDEKFTDCEASIREDVSDGYPVVRHTLRLKDDSIMRHQFYAYTMEDYLHLGLTVGKYGKNSALLSKREEK